MVLAGQDNRFHARRADCRRPLVRVELLGIEEHRVVVAVAHSEFVNVFMPKWMKA